jgi:GNAT superfamily N-acetyltransferase
VTKWRSRPLTSDHEVGGFDCRVGVLNHWLIWEALRYQVEGLARTYVWTAPDDPTVVAYYSITPTQLLRRDVTDLDAGGASVVPAYLLARLALSTRLQGRGLGSELLIDALEMIVRASQTAGGRLIVADAVNADAAAFYRHHDFIPVRESPHRLIMKVATARQALTPSEANTPDGETPGLVTTT